MSDADIIKQQAKDQVNAPSLLDEPERNLITHYYDLIAAKAKELLGMKKKLTPEEEAAMKKKQEEFKKWKKASGRPQASPDIKLKGIGSDIQTGIDAREEMHRKLNMGE